MGAAMRQRGFLGAALALLLLSIAVDSVLWIVSVVTDAALVGGGLFLAWKAVAPVLTENRALRARVAELEKPASLQRRAGTNGQGLNEARRGY
jgi:hypothetical protein